MKLTDIELAIPDDNRQARGRILLIGMLEDGPVGQPFSLSADKDPYTYLGRSPMTHTSTTLLNRGVPSHQVIYYRLNGTLARTTFTVNDAIAFEVQAITASDKQNNTRVIISPGGLTLQSNYAPNDTTELDKNYTRTYLFSEYPYLSDLASKINEDAMLGIIDVVAKEHQHLLSSESFVGGIYELSGGDRGAGYIHQETITDLFAAYPESYLSEYFELFSRHVLGWDYDGLSYQPLMRIPAETLLFPDIEADNYPDIIPLAAGIAQQKTEEQTSLCTAVFHTSPVPSSDALSIDDYQLDEETYWNESLQSPMPYMPYVKQEAYTQKLEQLFDWETMNADYWNYVMIVIGYDNFTTTYGDAAVAHLFRQTPVTDNPVNQFLPGFTLEHHLQQSMVARLSQKGYICIVPTVRRGNVCLTIQSLYQSNLLTPLSEWVNLRLLNHLQLELGYLLDKYVGKSFGFFTVSKVEQEISELFQTYSQYPRLQLARIDRIDQYPLENTIDIEISLAFTHNVHSVNSLIQIKPGGWELDAWNLIQ